jgi:hypothetical protein
MDKFSHRASLTALSADRLVLARLDAASVAAGGGVGVKLRKSVMRDILAGRAAIRIQRAAVSYESLKFFSIHG